MTEPQQKPDWWKVPRFSFFDLLLIFMLVQVLNYVGNIIGYLFTHYVLGW